MKTVKTLFIFVSVVLIGIALGGCDEAQQMIPPSVAGGDGDTTMPTVEPPTVETPADEDTTMPPVEEGDDSDAGEEGDDTTEEGDYPPEEGDDSDAIEEGDDDDTTVVPEGPVVSIMPASVTSPAVGEQLTVAIQIAGADNVFGYELTLMFDAAALRYVESANGDYLSVILFDGKKNDNQLTITAAAGAAGATASGTLATVTFEVVARQTSTLTLANVLLSDELGVTTEPHVVNAEAEIE